MFAILACGGSQKAAPPPAPTCDQLGPATEIAITDLKARRDLSPEAVAKLEAEMKPQIVTLCTQDAWAPSVIKCLVDAKAMADLEACDKQMTEPQRANVNGAMEKLVASVMPPAPAPSGSTGAPECDAFVAEMQAFMDCPKAPPEAHAAMEQAMPQMEQAWAILRDPKTPPETRKATIDGCKQGLDAMKQGMASLGCAP